MTDTTTANFLLALRSQVPTFVKAIENALAIRFELDVSSLEADHVCWRTETMEEYSVLAQALKNSPDECTLLVESEIGGRPIATFSLTKGIAVGPRVLKVIEIPAPKAGSAYGRGLEHVEFVIDSGNSHLSPTNNGTHQSTFDTFMQHYPNIPWDTHSKTKKINPDVSLKVELEKFGKCSVKFHLITLSKVIEYEKDAGTAAL